MKHADEVDMQGMNELRRLYAQAPDDQPPAALDAAILAQARSAVENSPPRSSAARWRAPLATAAVLVLSVVVVLNVQREQPEVLSVAEPAPQAPMSLQDQATKAARAQSSAAPYAASPTHSPAESSAASPTASSTASSTMAPAMSGAAEARVPSAESQREAGEASAIMSESGALAPWLAARPAAPMSRAAPRAQLQADSARSEAGVGSAVTTAQSTANMTAEQWLAHLVELKAQGRQQDFQDSLAQFRKRYPGYRIPESLTLEPAQHK